MHMHTYIHEYNCLQNCICLHMFSQHVCVHTYVSTRMYVRAYGCRSVWEAATLRNFFSFDSVFLCRGIMEQQIAELTKIKEVAAMQRDIISKMHAAICCPSGVEGA